MNPRTLVGGIQQPLNKVSFKWVCLFVLHSRKHTTIFEWSTKLEENVSSATLLYFRFPKLINGKNESASKAKYATDRKTFFGLKLFFGFRMIKCWFSARFEIENFLQKAENRKNKYFLKAFITFSVCFFKKWAILGLFFVYFCLFKQTCQFLQQIYVKNVMNIQYTAPGFEPTSFKHESLPITPILGLRPISVCWDRTQSSVNKCLGDCSW